MVVATSTSKSLEKRKERRAQLQKSTKILLFFLSDEVACTRFTMESSTVEAAGVIKLEVVEGRGRCVIAARDVAPGKQQRGCCTFL